MKDSLKSTTLNIYDELLEKIDSKEIRDKEQTIEYLKDSINTIATLQNKSSVDDIKNDYEDVANKSLSSYEHTNHRFEELAKMQKEILATCKQKDIDVPVIVDKLNNIQNMMFDEIQEANKTIVGLSKQIKTLKKESSLDALTKVFNRRALSTHLENICLNNNFEEDKHQLIILDIDDFKKVNDTYGHITGDKILIFIANIIQKTLKNYNKIYRFGGEEFVIVLDNIRYKEAKAIALKLLAYIRESKLIYKGKTINVTISVGIATLQNDDTPDTLLARADKALYIAKERGKDQMYSEIENGV